MNIKIKKRIATRATKKAVQRIVTKVRRTKTSCTLLWMTLFRS